MPFNRFNQWQPLPSRKCLPYASTDTCQVINQVTHERCIIKLWCGNRRNCRECGILICSVHSMHRYHGYKVCGMCYSKLNDYFRRRTLNGTNVSFSNTLRSNFSDYGKALIINKISALRKKFPIGGCSQFVVNLCAEIDYNFMPTIYRNTDHGLSAGLSTLSFSLMLNINDLSKLFLCAFTIDSIKKHLTNIMNNNQVRILHFLGTLQNLSEVGHMAVVIKKNNSITYIDQHLFESEDDDESSGWTAYERIVNCFSRVNLALSEPLKREYQNKITNLLN